MRKVAVVDDEPITRMDICGMLRELGYDPIWEAGDGFDAVSMCKKARPDAVLMDVKMPVFDGLSAAKTITSEDLADCVVLLTAFSDEEIVEKAAAAGVCGYLVKPVQQNRMRAVLEVALAQSARLKASQKQAKDAENKLSESKLIARAQGLYAKKNGLSESESYQLLRKTAMDKRLPLVEIAKAYLAQEENK